VQAVLGAIEVGLGVALDRVIARDTQTFADLATAVQDALRERQRIKETVLGTGIR
jgi:hypothetical protein